MKRHLMQSNLFDDLKSLKEKMNQDEHNNKEKLLEEQKKEKEKKLHEQFEKFMQNSGVKKLH
jgi:hypothetical protein